MTTPTAEAMFGLRLAAERCIAAFNAYAAEWERGVKEARQRLQEAERAAAVRRAANEAAYQAWKAEKIATEGTTP